MDSVIVIRMFVRSTMTSSSLDDRKHQPRWMRRVMEDAVDRRLVVCRCLMRDIATGIAVPTEAREIAARYFQLDAMSGQEHVRCRPHVEPQFIHRIRFE